MKTRFRIDGHLIECTSEPLEGTYFRVTWNLRPADHAETEAPLHTESYVCRASTDAEAQDAVQTRARLMSGLRLGSAVAMERYEHDPTAQTDSNMPPDAPL